MDRYYIYITTNKVNGHTYIGQKKLSENETPETDGYLGSGDNLRYKAIPKYGKENFKKEVLEFCKTKYEADILEKKWIAYYRSIGKAEYNIADGGQGGDMGIEVNKRISQSLKGRTTWAKGVHFSEEHKEKIRQSNLGQKRSEECKKHNSEARKRWFAQGNKTKGSKGMHWFNNGDIEIIQFECPEGFVPGRCPKAKASISKGMKNN